MPGKKVVLAAVAVAALAGGAIAYFHFKGASGDALSPQAIASVIPDDAYFATFISTDDKAWSQLKQFGTADAQKVVGKSIQDLQQKLLTNSNIDYDKDVKPWAGNVMIAALPSNTGATKEPNLLVVVGIKDKASALSFANKLQSESKVKAVESDYKGVKITNFPSEKQSSYTAVLKDYLVLAPDKKAVEQAIDTFKGEPSFTAKAGSILSAQAIDLPNSIARIYVPDYATATQQLLALSPQMAQLPASSLNELKKVKSVVGGLGIDAAGVRLKAMATLDPTAMTVEYKPIPGSVVAQFPTDTFALITAAGINRYWSQAVAQSKSNPQSEAAIEQMRQSARAINLDLDKDVFGWMDGEFALGLIASDQGILSQIGFGGAMVFDTSNRATAEATLSKLDGLVQNNGFIRVATREVQGKKVTEWQSPQGVLLGHGWLDQDSVFVAIGEPLVTAIATKPGQTLDASDAYKTVMGGLPKERAGAFYLDLDKTMTLVNRTMLVSQKQAMSPETIAVLNSIRGIGLTSTQVDKSTGQIEMLLALKPAK